MKGYDARGVSQLKVAAAAEFRPLQFGDHRVFSGGDENVRPQEIAFYRPAHLLDREGACLTHDQIRLPGGRGVDDIELAATAQGIHGRILVRVVPVSYTHLRAHETPEHLVC